MKETVRGWGNSRIENSRSEHHTLSSILLYCIQMAWKISLKTMEKIKPAGGLDGGGEKTRPDPATV